jgi:hypothetical protein
MFRILIALGYVKYARSKKASNPLLHRKKLYRLSKKGKEAPPADWVNIVASRKAQRQS